MKKNYIFLLFLLPLMFSQCTKDDNCCTCEVGYSESGLGTMGCLMDGVPWAACNFAHEEVKGSVSVYRDNSSNQDYWEIKCSKNFNGGDEAIYVHIWNPQMGDIPNYNGDRSKTFGSISAEFYTKKPGYSGNYIKDTTQSFHLEVTKLDKENHIISGRFECTLKEHDGGVDTTTIKITNGVFDTRY